ncbi:hypothetical protein ALC62_08198 [Cyphomyrmex costatus]|uniref:Uncharacterized protein n=1 Tax=Cyphomyrmex costatus TaxID=456900 RepID=A0A195CKI9_9HYME|nr:hypothetical protein ALC62_08198 [Cyphomyrmex costatus]
MHEHVVDSHQARTRTFPPAPRFLSTLHVRGCFLEVVSDRGKERGTNDI